MLVSILYYLNIFAAICMVPTFVKEIVSQEFFCCTYDYQHTFLSHRFTKDVHQHGHKNSHYHGHTHKHSMIASATWVHDEDTDVEEEEDVVCAVIQFCNRVNPQSRTWAAHDEDV